MVEFIMKPRKHIARWPIARFFQNQLSGKQRISLLIFPEYGFCSLWTVFISFYLTQKKTRCFAPHAMDGGATGIYLKTQINFV